jgi:hypothetical protein
MQQSRSWDANWLQLVKKFPAFYGTRRFITALTSARHLSNRWRLLRDASPRNPPPSEIPIKMIIYKGRKISVIVRFKLVNMGQITFMMQVIVFLSYKCYWLKHYSSWYVTQINPGNFYWHFSVRARACRVIAAEYRFLLSSFINHNKFTTSWTLGNWRFITASKDQKLIQKITVKKTQNYKYTRIQLWFISIVLFVWTGLQSFFFLKLLVKENVYCVCN